MSEPRVVTPFAFGTGGGPVRVFGPTVEKVKEVEPGKAVEPVVTGSVEQPAPVELQTAVPTPTPPTPGSLVEEVVGKPESSSATPAPSEPSANHSESPKESTTESGADETSTTEKALPPKELDSPTPTVTVPSAPSAPKKVDK